MDFESEDLLFLVEFNPAAVYFNELIRINGIKIIEKEEDQEQE